MLHILLDRIHKRLSGDGLFLSHNGQHLVFEDKNAWELEQFVLEDLIPRYPLPWYLVPRLDQPKVWNSWDCSEHLQSPLHVSLAPSNMASVSEWKCHERGCCDNQSCSKRARGYHMHFSGPASEIMPYSFGYSFGYKQSWGQQRYNKKGLDSRFWWGEQSREYIVQETLWW